MVPSSNSAAPMATTPDNTTDAGPPPLLIMRSPTNHFIASMPIRRPINGSFTRQVPLSHSLSRMRPGAIPINISADRKSQADGEVYTWYQQQQTQQPDPPGGEDDAITASPAGDANYVYNMQQGNAIYLTCSYIY